MRQLIQRMALGTLVAAVTLACNTFNEEAPRGRFSGKEDKFSKVRFAWLKLPSGDKVQVELAITPSEQAKGLSDLKPKDFSKDRGMLFFYPHSGIRQFWMPNTYMDLDLFFLNDKLEVINIVRGLPKHPGFDQPPKIARTEPVMARHVLEMRADSKISEKIKQGDQLSWEGPSSLEETESKIRSLR